MEKLINKFKTWLTTTVKEAIFDNWSELVATLLAFYGYQISDGNVIFGISFFILLSYWIFWRLLGLSKVWNKKRWDK